MALMVPELRFKTELGSATDMVVSFAYSSAQKLGNSFRNKVGKRNRPVIFGYFWVTIAICTFS